MEHCFNWHLPPKPDLVVVEYAVNFDTTVDEDAASFERLLRQLLKLPGAPAVLLLNTLELMVHPASWGANVQRIFFSGCDGYGCLKAPPWADSNDLAFPYEAKAEDAIVRLAGYYGVPSVSLRGALYSELKSNSTRWPLKQLFHDRHHPAAWGHSLMAQLVIDRIRAALDAVAARRSAGSRPQSVCAAVSAEAAAGTPGPSGYPLLAPLLSPSVEAPVGLCLKGDELTRAMLNSSTFAYRVEGTDAKMKPGIIGTAPGEHAEFCIDVDRLGRGERFTVLLGHLVSYEHMGIARVTCEGECSCPAEEVDAFVKGGQFSVFKAKVLELARARAPAAKPPPRAGCGCQLRLEILPKSGSGEFKFKVLSLMTASKPGQLKFGHQAGFNVRPEEPRTEKTEQWLTDSTNRVRERERKGELPPWAKTEAKAAG
uniref:SGNH hydrolase-type esterase domain-containing protein n=2 Tax=Emiliania huxleyi TaxID=2903 RepID=A0A7S3S018_EMIHU